MKRSFILLTAMAVAAVAFSACQKTEEGKKSELKTPVLTVSPTTVTFPENEADLGTTACNFSWTSAADNASYTVEFAKTNNQKFANPQTVSVAAGALTMDLSFTKIVEILDAFEMPEASEFSFLARVSASAQGLSPVSSEAVKITVKVPEPKKSLRTPVLTSDRAEVEVDPTSTDVAVSISWTDAAVDGLVPSYRMTVSLNPDMSDSQSVDVPDGTMGVDYIHSELAQVLSELGFDSLNLYVTITASAEGAEPVTSNVLAITLVLKKMPEQLYIYFWSWTDPANAQQMTKVSDGVFSWSGQCDQWQFVFMLDNVDYWSGFMRQENAADYWTLRKSSDPECVFSLNDVGLPAGDYTITADLNTMKVTVEKNPSKLPEHLYIDCWAWGGGSAAKEMTALGDGKFSWEGVLPLWNFKFTTSNATDDDYWTGYFRDPDASDYWTLKETSVEKMFSFGDIGWQEGVYTINVDLNTLKVEAVPHVWPIGAMSWGWEKSGAEMMEYKGNGVLEWTGNLGNGNFKFLTDLENEYWPGYWRDENASEYWTITNTYTTDAQFNIEHDGIPAGVCKITLDLNAKTVKVDSITPAE